jgi:hypothetical protein
MISCFFYKQKWYHLCFLEFFQADRELRVRTMPWIILSGV